MAHATASSSVETKKQNKKRKSENVALESMDHFTPSTIIQPSPPDGGWGWVVVLASFLIHVITDGVTYSFGVFYVELLYYFEGGKGATAWIASLLVGITLGSGPISGFFVNKFGCRIVTISGSILASASLLLSVWAPNIVTLYFTIGIGTGLGFGLIYLPAIVSVTCYFEKYRSLATGIAVCGSGLGTLIFAPCLEYVIAFYGWRGAIMICSGIVLNCIVLGALFRPIEVEQPWKESSSEDFNKTRRQESVHNKINANNAFKPRPDDTSMPIKSALSQPMLLSKVSSYDTVSIARSLGGSQVMSRHDVLYLGSLDSIRHQSSHLVQRRSEETVHNHTSFKSLPNKVESIQRDDGEYEACTEEKEDVWHKMLDISLLKDPVFILFTFSNFCTSIGFYVPYVYVLPQAEERGISKNDASYLLAVIGVANTVGRISLGYIADKPWVDRLLIYNLCLAVCGIATTVSMFCTSFISFALYTTVFGFTSGAYVGLTSVILVDLLGLSCLTNAFGLLLLFQGVASLLGPPIAGWLYDALGSYNPGFLAAGGMITISGLMLFFIPPIKRKIQRNARNQKIESRINTESI